MDRVVVQVDKSHYEFSKYVDIKRFASYYYQVREVLENYSGGNILIVGKGDGIVEAIIRCCINAQIDSFDFDGDLHPDYTGDIRQIQSIVDRKYEVVVCCQVLEHIPFEEFDLVLTQLADICSGVLILSLPYRNFSFSFKVDMPKIRNKSLIIEIPRFFEKKIPWTGEHYWEVGTKKKSKHFIKKKCSQYFDVKKMFVVPENTYHIFYICKVK